VALQYTIGLSNFRASVTTKEQDKSTAPMLICGLGLFATLYCIYEALVLATTEGVGEAPPKIG